jgi:hypothetical protein
MGSMVRFLRVAPTEAIVQLGGRACWRGDEIGGVAPRTRNAAHILSALGRYAHVVSEPNADPSDDPREGASSASADDEQTATSELSSQSSPDLPPVIRAASGLGGLLAVVLTILIAPAPLEGATIASLVTAVVLHRRVWRYPPILWAWLLVILVGTAAGLIIGSQAGSMMSYPARFAQSLPGNNEPLSPHGVLGLRSYVRLAGTSQWKDQVQAVPGQVVQWVLYVSNDNSKRVFTDVDLSDLLPPHVRILGASMKFIDARGTTQLRPDPLFGGGYDAGDYNPNDSTLTIFSGVLQSDFAGCAVDLLNPGRAVTTAPPAGGGAETSG